MRIKNDMLRTVPLSLLISMAVGVLPAYPHGAAIDVLVNDQGQLVPFLFPSGTPIPQPSVFAFSTIGQRNFVDSPGLGIVNLANGVAPNTLLQLDMAGPLVFWNGTSVAPTSATITVEMSDGIGAYQVTANTGKQTGLDWGIYQGDLFWESHGFYFLDPVNAEAGLYGIWFQIDSPTYLSSEPMLVPFLFDPADQFSEAQVESGIGALLTLNESLVGDFNNDNTIDAADIDALSQIVRNGTDDSAYDLTNDLKVDEQDRVFWVEQIAMTFFGDANFDLQFNSDDFVHIFIAGEYNDDLTANSTWGTGDWNGDAEFDAQDFVTAFIAGGYDAGPRVVTVAEPSTVLLALLSVAALKFIRLGSNMTDLTTG